MGGCRRSKGIHSTQKGKKQKSYSYTDKSVLRGGRFLKIQNRICNYQKYKQLKITIGKIQFLSVNSDYLYICIDISQK